MVTTGLVEVAIVGVELVEVEIDGEGAVDPLKLAVGEQGGDIWMAESPLLMNCSTSKSRSLLISTFLALTRKSSTASTWDSETAKS